MKKLSFSFQTKVFLNPEIFGDYKMFSNSPPPPQDPENPYPTQVLMPDIWKKKKTQFFQFSFSSNVGVILHFFL